MSLLSIQSLSAQTFKVSDIKVSDNITDFKAIKLKQQYLGTCVKLTEFDHDIKLEEINKDGTPKESILFQSQKDGTYKAVYNEQTAILKIEKFLGYYRSLEFSRFDGGKWQFTVFMKRE